MNDLMIFKNEEFGEIRSLEINNEPYFVGKEIATVLGYERTDNAIRQHVDEEDKLMHQISASGQNRNMTLINESGLYSLIMSSKLPNAKKFKRWVTSEVLPAIRKTGGYIAGEENMTEDELILKAMNVLNTKTKTFEFLHTNGTKGSRTSMMWTQKGRLFLYEFLKAKGLFPRMEEEQVSLY